MEMGQIQTAFRKGGQAEVSGRAWLLEQNTQDFENDLSALPIPVEMSDLREQFLISFVSC